MKKILVALVFGASLTLGSVAFAGVDVHVDNGGFGVSINDDRHAPPPPPPVHHVAPAPRHMPPPPPPRHHKKHHRGELPPPPPPRY